MYRLGWELLSNSKRLLHLVETRKCSRANKENEDPEAKVMQTCQQLSCLGMALVQVSACKWCLLQNAPFPPADLAPHATSMHLTHLTFAQNGSQDAALDGDKINGAGVPSRGRPLAQVRWQWSSTLVTDACRQVCKQQDLYTSSTCVASMPAWTLNTYDLSALCHGEQKYADSQTPYVCHMAQDESTMSCCRLEVALIVLQLEAGVKTEEASLVMMGNNNTSLCGGPSCLF